MRRVQDLHRPQRRRQQLQQQARRRRDLLLSQRVAAMGDRQQHRRWVRRTWRRDHRLEEAARFKRNSKLHVPGYKLKWLP
ncbi:hypothetical protein PHSY_007243 [Pseudozyma hubeiensis SY62]|uniref:Uncharacterized protein n=1 Tax=Pseudozyma hubeiensis (strain SY62) TaxID=1305764 RepID=R9PNC2_PSEHS|nr:hypothetical protein PHSY_007243 [Pseudozyma hubeiensis SY62]GAC99640.1 hypothetical protein PHSY_007243 [Pseudozyma hubeiensis SY62]